MFSSGFSATFQAAGALSGKTRVDDVGQRVEEFVGHRPALVESELALRIRVGGDGVENCAPVAVERALRAEDLGADHAAVDCGELFGEIFDSAGDDAAAVHETRHFDAAFRAASR